MADAVLKCIQVLCYTCAQHRFRCVGKLLVRFIFAGGMQQYVSRALGCFISVADVRVRQTVMMR